MATYLSTHSLAIALRQGLAADTPSGLLLGEPYYATDSERLRVGNGDSTYADLVNAVDLSGVKAATYEKVDAAGDLIYGSAADTLARLAIGTNGKKLFSTGTAPEWATGLKIGTFTYDLSTASGTQAITGVGFTPTVLILLGALDGTTAFSLSFDNGTNAYGTAQDTSNLIQAETSLHIYETGGDASAVVTTLGSDGFTLTWTKNSSPTGTANIYYVAIR